MTISTEQPRLKAWTAREALESAARTSNRWRRWREATGFTMLTGIDGLDHPAPGHSNTPFGPGDLVIVHGCTGEGKSTFTTSIARNAVRQIAATTSVVDDVRLVGVIVQTEELVETRAIQFAAVPGLSANAVMRGEAPQDLLDLAIAQSGDLPVVFMGQSSPLGAAMHNGRLLAEDEAGEGTRISDGAISVNRIASTIYHMERHMRMSPAFVVIDHVHDLIADTRTRTEGERFYQVDSDLANLASFVGCPLILVAQDNKDIKQRPPNSRMPTKYDIRYLSQVTAKARDILGVWQPRIDLPIGTEMPVRIDSFGRQLTVRVSSDLILVEAGKQRYGQSGQRVALSAGGGRTGRSWGDCREITDSDMGRDFSQGFSQDAARNSERVPF